MTPAEELTAAADKLDELMAEVAFTPGPWRTGRASRSSVYDSMDCTVAELDGWSPRGNEALARYIAAMNPDVGRALVALLRSCAAYHGARGTRSWLGTDYGLEQLVRAILAPKETI